jgi:hypothetical protein
VVTAAARALAPLRLTGLLALATARRRLGSVLLGAGMVGSLVLHVSGVVVKLAREPAWACADASARSAWRELQTRD